MHELSFTFHNEDASTGRKIQFNSIAELRTREFWIEFFRNLMEESLNKINSGLDKKDDNYSIENYMLESNTQSLNFYTKFYKTLHTGFGGVFSPELLKLSNTNDNEILDFVKNNDINFYSSEFNYRCSLAIYFSKAFFYNKNIGGDILKEIFNGNSTTIKNLEPEHIEILEDIFETENSYFELNNIPIEDYGYNEELRKIMNTDNTEDRNHIRINDTELEVIKAKCFTPRGLRYIRQHGHIIKMNEGFSSDFIYTEEGPDFGSLIFLYINEKTYIYSSFSGLNIYNIIANFETIKDNIDKFPKYNIMDEINSSTFFNYLKVYF